MSTVVIVSDGVVAKSVIDAAVQMQRWSEFRVLEDHPSTQDEQSEWPIVGALADLDVWVARHPSLIVAMTDAHRRVDLLRHAAAGGCSLPVVVHPSACISQYARVEDGTCVLANSVVNCDAHVGFGCVLESAVTIDHDCTLGTGVHVGAGVNLAGNVRVGEYATLGVGVTVVQGVSIGPHAFVEAGAVVTADIAAYARVAGVPARVRAE